MAKDANWSSVVLAMHMDGANNGVVFTDQKGKVITPYAGVITSTTRYAPLAGDFSSAYFDGTGDHLRLAAGLADFNFGTGDLTIEVWAYITSSGAGRMFSIQGGSPFNMVRLGFGPSYIVASLAGGGNTQLDVVKSGSFQNAWHHLAFTRQSGECKLFIDGTLQSSGMHPHSVTFDPALQPFIGSYDGSTEMFQGYLDDLRITKGVARYTANFTAPTEPFPNGPYEVGGLIVDSNAQPVSRTVRVYDRVTGALAGSGQSSPVTGLYNVGINTANEVQVIMLDDALGTLENDQIIRTTPV